ncbi:hypothetical protein LIER_20363 [Lithospermum erythrorhizon]|uniref:Reverse transcriptase domain-containing protein n=1 Tax=Lithospermum erythrorhizon TaxID=34254 RepID=A0AAV3QL83_LITER
MSPALFLLCLEYFSRLFRAASPGFSFHLICGEVGITHIAFADDLMLFSKRDISSVGILLDYLSHLERCSGLPVRPANSSVYLDGVRGPKKDAILARVQWVHENYLKGVSIWDYVKRRKDSLLMWCLCNLRDTLVAAFGGRAEAIEGLELLGYAPLSPICALSRSLVLFCRGVSSFGCILSRAVLSGSSLVGGGLVGGLLVGVF